MHKLDLSPPKLVNLCTIANAKIYVKFKTGKHLPSKLKGNKGLRKGDAIAPLLFNVTLEIAIWKSKVHTEPYLTDEVKL